MQLRALAPGKVNLCLVLGQPRPDGRHRLLTVFQSLSLADELVLSTAAGIVGDFVSCPGVEGENLVTRALRGLRERGWDAPPVRIDVDKRIPVAAGMGGGSADAAATLRLAQELAPGRPEEVAELAVALGADVPGQLAPGAVLGLGAGDDVTPLAPLASHAFVIVGQHTPLATADVFREADRLGLPRSDRALEREAGRLQQALRPGARLPDELLVNDLEPAAISLLPQIADALRAVREVGAQRALVCGSGPTVAGLFWGPEAAAQASEAAATLSDLDPPPLSAVPVGPEFGAPTCLSV